MSAYLFSMNFKQGQHVRIKGKQMVGLVEKKLTSLDDVYVVLLGDKQEEEKLVRGADLEVIDINQQKTA
ncbi:MAG: hypothetical protein ACLGXA_06325 [Acidobacteriota bacterium]